MYNIEIYEDNNGKSEIKEYLEKLSSEKNKNKSSKIAFEKIITYIDLLMSNGLSLSTPYIKKIDKEIWEIRPLKNRILFANVYDNTFVLLSIFMKQTRKTPKMELERAKRLLKDYKNRRERNE